jgi:hypothetical protein
MDIQPSNIPAARPRRPDRVGRWALVLVAAGAAVALVVPWRKHLREAPPVHLVGKTVDVNFSKAAWVSWLANPAYAGLVLTSATEKRMCFRDPSGAFVRQNKREAGVDTPGSQPLFEEDGTFCVPRQWVSSLWHDGEHVWGPNVAYPR